MINEVLWGEVPSKLLFPNRATVSNLVESLGPVVAQRLTAEAQARHAVRVFKSSSAAPRTLQAHEVQVFADGLGRFGFTGVIRTCSNAPNWQLLRVVIDSGATQTCVPRWALCGAGVPSGASRVADGRNVPTETARVHLHHRSLPGLLTFDAISFRDGGESDHALLGMDVLRAFDFNHPMSASVALRSPEVKACACD